MMDLTPDPGTIVQEEEEPITTIPTRVEGPVETRELPGIGRGYKTEQGVTTAAAIRLLSMEPRRKSAVIIPVGGDIWLAGSQASAQMGGATAFRIPAGVVFTINHRDAMWCCAVSGTVDVSVMTTFWSE